MPAVRRPSPVAAAIVLGACVAVLAATLGGCGLFDDDAGPTTTTPSTSSTTTAPPSAVLDEGQAPRKELRLAFTEGDTTTVTVALDLDVTQDAGGTTQELDTPVVTETVRFTVDAVDGAAADVSFAFTAVALDASGTDLTAEEQATLTEDLQGLVGLGGSGRVTDRGAFTEFGYDLPADLDPSVSATLEQFEDQLGTLSLPLPAEPLGIGGRWRTTVRSTLAGVTLDQVTTYEITDFTDTGVSYTATSTQSGGAQDLDPATLPDGTTARLVSSDVSGTGSGTLDLSSLVATASSELAGTQVIDLSGADGEADGEPVRLTQRLDLRVAVEAAG